MTFVIKQGDTFPYLDELLFDGRKRLVDPTGWTVVFNMAQNSVVKINAGAAFVVSLVVDTATAAVISAAGYTLSDGSPFVAGTYPGVEYRWTGLNDTASSSGQDGTVYEWQTTDLSGRIETFPNSGNNTMTIFPQIN